MSIRRARLSLLAAVGVAAAILVFELPVNELLHQRSQISETQGQLSSIEARNAALRASIAALRQPATIGAIAHLDYGLVKPGEQAYAIEPASSKDAAGAQRASDSSGSLSDTKLPNSDFAIASATALGIGSGGNGSVNSSRGTSTHALTTSATHGGRSSTAGSPGLWNEVLGRLEWWRSAF